MVITKHDKRGGVGKSQGYSPGTPGFIRQPGKILGEGDSGKIWDNEKCILIIFIMYL